MIEFEVLIVIAVALAVWLFVHFRKKHGSEVESVVAPNIPTEPEPKLEPEPEPEPEPIKVKLAEDAIKAVNIVPEDSTLRRHYLQNLNNTITTTDVINEGAKEAKIAEDEVTKPIVGVTSVTSGVPEDSALKRHFIQQLNAEAAATLPPRPTDSTLKRHYDAQLLSLISRQLEELK